MIVENPDPALTIENFIVAGFLITNIFLCILVIFYTLPSIVYGFKALKGFDRKIAEESFKARYVSNLLKARIAFVLIVFDSVVTRCVPLVRIFSHDAYFSFIAKHNLTYQVVMPVGLMMAGVRCSCGSIQTKPATTKIKF